jgi:hypothetical protein
MSFTQNFDAKELFRYVIPGIIVFVILLPHMNKFIPGWNTYDPVAQLGFAAFIILAFGVVIEIIVDLFSQPIVCHCCKSKNFRKLFKLKENDPIFCNDPEKKAHFIAKMSNDDRDLIWRSSALVHMFVGTAIAFFISAVLNFVQVIFVFIYVLPYNILFLPMVSLLIFSSLIIISLKMAIIQAKVRQDYYDVFKTEYNDHLILDY